MTELSCSYGDDRDEAIVAFLYDDADGSGSPAERARFETHLATCTRCRADVAALRGVRAQLARWAPPEPSFAVVSRQSSVVSHQSSAVNRQSAAGNPQSAIRNPQWWRDVPSWAQVAAALLFLGVSAGVANLDVRYDQNGLSVRTGWSSRPGGSGEAGGAGRSGGTEVAQGFSPAAVKPAVVAQGPADQPAPWRADLAALERQMRTEFRAAQASAPAADADVTRRVRALVEDSEKRQQRELALRIAELVRDVNAQRQADLVKIDRTLGVVQNTVGIEVMKNRQQLNQMDLLYRASQRQ